MYFKLPEYKYALYYDMYFLLKSMGCDLWVDFMCISLPNTRAFCPTIHMKKCCVNIALESKNVQVATEKLLLKHVILVSHITVCGLEKQLHITLRDY